MKNKVKLLETTLRDGSYAVDFKFTPKDTAIIASALEQVGFELIEIGHGLGLHAKEKNQGDAAATDAEYLEAASSVLKKAKYGMFCIPGIARLEDIDLAAEFGMDFIRIGTNINELKETYKYFERARKYNMYVSSNLMKSYAVPAREFGKYTGLARKYGADIAVLVDSAGGMLPNEIEEYFKYSKEASDIDLGFHGHNNLGLANANTIKAIESGAAIVDTSLKGIGRSAGNAVTEMIVMCMKKLGYDLDIDEYAVMDLGEKYISPLIHQVKDTPISITTGFAQFHSSFMGTILKYADKYRIDPRELIIKLTEKDKINAPEDLVESLAREIKTGKGTATLKQISPATFQIFIDAEKESLPNKQIEALVNEIHNESKKKGKNSIFNIVLSSKNENFISKFVQESPLFITGSMEISDYGYMEKLIDSIKGDFDYILLDCSIKKDEHRIILNNLLNAFDDSNILIYNDLFLWAKSVVSLINVLCGNLLDKKILIYGNNNLADYISKMINDFGAETAHLRNRKEAENASKENRPEIFKGLNAIISCDRSHKLKKSFIERVKTIDFVVDADIGSLDDDCTDYLNDLDIRMIRPDMRSAVAGEIQHQILNKNLAGNDLGRISVKDHNVISGGLIGKKDDIIVDSISSPTQVIGIAEGNGRVNYSFTEEQKIIVREIQSYIDQRF